MDGRSTVLKERPYIRAVYSPTVGKSQASKDTCVLATRTSQAGAWKVYMLIMSKSGQAREAKRELEAKGLACVY